MTVRGAADTVRGAVARAVRAGSSLGPREEALLWALAALAVVGARAHLWYLWPCYGWSSDSWDYVKQGFAWVDTGAWQPDVRRGTLYPFFIGVLLRVFGDLSAVAVAHHAIGAASILGAAAALRAAFGRACAVPICLMAAAYGLWTVPAYIEHLIRNEAFLFGCATLAFAGLHAASSTRRDGWFFAAGLGFGLMAAVKNMFHPFPVCVLAVLAWERWRTPASLAAATGLFLAGALGPGIAVRFAERGATKETAGYEGIQLYGRVGQWTVLEGGTHQQIKSLIRDKVSDYQAFVAREGRLDNNLFIKDLVIEPIIKETMRREGKSYADINRVCRDLAFEAIVAHKAQYAAQVWGDFSRLHMKYGWKSDLPRSDDIKGGLEDLREDAVKHPAAHFDIGRVIPATERATGPRHFGAYGFLARLAGPFEWWPPVLMTSLLILPAGWFAPRGQRVFWVAAVATWFFYLALFSTVGKPLQRYLIPVAPLMFFTFGTALCVAWQAAGRRPDQG